MDSVLLPILAEQEEIGMPCYHRRNHRKSTDFMKLSDEAFIKSFRLSKEAFRYVLEEIENCLTTRKGGLSTEVKLAACLRFFAEGNYQHGAGQDYHIAIAQPTFSKVLTEMLNILERTLCKKWISLNMTEDEQRRAKLHFYQKTSIPGVIMCLDGTHVKIIPPKLNRNLFFNRKGFYSLNVLIVCDDQQRIRFVDPTFQGSNHDSHIWRVSPARTHFEQLHQNGEVNTKILGDAGYPSEPWLVTPFRAAEEGSLESDFNRRHALGRAIVERTIGLLKNRFRCILGARQLHYNPTKCAQIINVCCALHNICLEFGRSQ
ncbi:putative nuclease HARBI1 [Toxorhynchites rutilus septentrionalis]|uniref:putative nuclease HARBI1 n=2 Tax=Toxorhynchites rutilus septentrionalis TaxID=329112 RepID=UPI0024787DE1|nr:putative nuclease HARBI1 [Toxorhynchites rutilus septentrionalis]XP_055616105.1 putative nuclease HARBI1 [Toxorhynchites rutilus septentrionalis]XP_055616965.1 putative nuclease HARBI1 [Toxorhynchites rutilus septentrionalis]XP_055618175.1 putative nuclease HARBI1 [Toxorhynchites rutilus septentrionalis]XP_055618176.1 putative nuclease HARBI1 [Toxorhynchites rutilus septentrionalis]XP_055618177.1 putative nuclease HARBI1 [Toxorhynchites rutilus septentrionalis]XP_055624008.1 putative nucle